MNDLIYRQTAIEAIAKLLAYHGSDGAWIDQKEALDVLKSLPSAQQEPEWSPVSEGLPKNNGYVWCIYFDGTMGYCYFDAQQKMFVSEFEIVAWMPLPKPYRKEIDLP